MLLDLWLKLLRSLDQRKENPWILFPFPFDFLPLGLGFLPFNLETLPPRPARRELGSGFQSRGNRQPGAPTKCTAPLSQARKT